MDIYLHSFDKYKLILLIIPLADNKRSTQIDLCGNKI